ncbi:DGQHR domain-containing protein [Vibrio europaeus]|uniref:DGQHR domain-containing protein n=1 Tax=Vibrio europaeus TaxID=300876 RepID=UPI00233EAD5C|nr:DGQHR domain-containing protein [Vibrio europaeus]MDC5753595.1 DGQHR domain-containing protein [Vibrio europaeus]MDC5816492.1 DGQHR domain-containing protein [Vibrio europaeus]
MKTIKPTLNLTSQHIYAFAAALGFQYKPFYNICVPARTLVKLLRIDDAGTTMERSQRSVSEPRAKAFADYLVSNLKSKTPFIIPTVTGCIDSSRSEGFAGFVSAQEQCDLDNLHQGFASVGVLCVGMDSEFYLFDGQHRGRGIAIGLDYIWNNRHQPEYADIDLATISIPLKVYLDLTLEERQTFFSDINMNMAKPQASIGIAYDHRDLLSRFAVEIAQELPFKGLVELERNTISKKSEKLFPLKTIRDLVKSLMGLGNKYAPEEITEEKKEFVRDVLAKFSRPMGWSALEFTGEAAEIRETSIITHTVMLKAVAEAAKTVSSQFPNFEGVDFSKLSDLNYGRTEGDFIGRCIDPVAKTMRMNQTGINLTANKLVTTLGATLDPSAKTLEKQYFPELKASQEEKEPQPEPAIKEKAEEPAQSRASVFKSDVRSIVLHAAGTEEKTPNVITRAAGGVVKAILDYENKHSLSLVPVIDIMKEHILKVVEHEGQQASWSLVKSPKAAVKLIEAALKETGMIA